MGQKLGAFSREGASPVLPPRFSQILVGQRTHLGSCLSTIINPLHMAAGSTRPMPNSTGCPCKRNFIPNVKTILMHDLFPARSLSENWKGSRSWLGRGRCKAARRRRCRCTSSRSANEADAPSKPEPEGRMGVARRSLRCSSSTMCIDIASSSRLALAVQAPCARPLQILGQAPSR